MSWSRLMLAMALIGALTGCSSDAADGCTDYCAGLCEQRADCADAAVADSCVDQCMEARHGAGCGQEEPPDQLTCAELHELTACNAYCPAFCERASACASFDESVCLRGCISNSPVVCNVASVAPRSCDQIKLEARGYAGDGSVALPGLAIPQHGLCRGRDDCEEPDVCIAATNTCGPCTVDADCANETYPSVCGDDGACASVECNSDEDCSKGLCDLAAHTCDACQKDDDCTDIPRFTCDVPRMTCVECLQDFQCGMQANDKCEPVTKTCVRCLSNADCPPAVPTCDLKTHSCG